MYVPWRQYLLQLELEIRIKLIKQYVQEKISRPKIKFVVVTFCSGSIAGRECGHLPTEL